MIHKLIKTDNYLLIVDDSEIEFGNYVTDKYRVWQWKDDSSLLGRHKIIAHLPLNHLPFLKGVDLLPEINEINRELIFKTIGGSYGLESIQEHDQVDGYFDTYKEAEIALIKKIIEFECEMEDYCGSPFTTERCPKCIDSCDRAYERPKTITTSQGVQWVGKYRLI